MHLHAYAGSRRSAAAYLSIVHHCFSAQVTRQAPSCSKIACSADRRTECSTQRRARPSKTRSGFSNDDGDQPEHIRLADINIVCHRGHINDANHHRRYHIDHFDIDSDDFGRHDYPAHNHNHCCKRQCSQPVPGVVLTDNFSSQLLQRHGQSTQSTRPQLQRSRRSRR